MQLDGIVHSAHTECAFQAGKTARHKGRSACGHQDLIIRCRLAVRGGDRFGNSVHGSHAGVGDDVGFVLGGDLVQGAKGEQPLIGQAPRRIISGQHGVVGRQVGVAVHVHGRVTARFADGPQCVVARAPESDDRKSFHGLSDHSLLVGYCAQSALATGTCKTAKRGCTSFLGIPFRAGTLCHRIPEIFGFEEVYLLAFFSWTCLLRNCM